VLTLGQWYQFYLRFVQFSIIDSWHTDTDGGLVIGIVLSFIVSALSVGFPFVKDRILGGTRIKVTVAYVINYLIKIIIMGLVMTMNAWVCVVVILGITFGQMGF
jgi:hypothetical protein